MTEPPRSRRHLSVVHPATEPSAAVSPPAPGPGMIAPAFRFAATARQDRPAVETVSAGKQYGSRWVLQDCTLRVPQGRVVAVVGPNGAGKTTLLQTMVGLSRPTVGTVSVLGEPSWPAHAGLLAKIGFVAQEKPLYRGVRVVDLIRMGGRLNPGWDRQYAIDRLADRGVPLTAKVGRLSGGQRTQVALVMALAKRPSLLVLDEPLADLDPLARREVLGELMVDLVDRDVTVVLSSHVLADLVRVCDWLILINSGRVLVSEPIDALLAGHRLVVGPVELADRMSRRFAVVSDARTERQARLLIRIDGEEPLVDPRWQVTEPSLEEFVMAHLATNGSAP